MPPTRPAHHRPDPESRADDPTDTDESSTEAAPDTQAAAVPTLVKVHAKANVTLGGVTVVYDETGEVPDGPDTQAAVAAGLVELVE